jgi:PAS domain S-box-containing protein
MEASELEELRRHLRARRDLIARRWQRAILPTGFAGLAPAEVPPALARHTDTLIDLLLAEPFAPEGAQAIGTALVALRFLAPESLQGTLQTLARELPDDLPTAPCAALQPRLTALLNEVAAGFCAAMRTAILAGQEAERRVQLVERERVEAALRASEARLRAVVTNTPVMLFALDRDGVFTLAEGKGLAGLGLTPAAVVGQSVFAFFAVAPALLRNVRRALAGEDCTVVAVLGELVIEARHTPVRDGAGAVTGVIGVAVDITARARAEEHLRAVVDHAPLILFAADQGGTITLSAGQGLAALGRRPGELVGQSAWANALPVPGLVADLRRALAGEAFATTATVRGVTFEIHCTPRRDPDGAPAGVIGVALDITARVAAERAARRLAIHLSPQEARILLLLARADLRTYRAIGVVAYISGETARGHAKAIARKLGLATADRAVIAATARDLGLLPEPTPPANA